LVGEIHVSSFLELLVWMSARGTAPFARSSDIRQCVHRVGVADVKRT